MKANSIIPEINMFSYEEIAKQFSEKFNQHYFPDNPATLYEPANYFLGLGGKRIRPVLCLMANEMFGEIIPDAWNVAIAIELFHNFTLIHDDIMDNAKLRRGKETVHHKYGSSSALLAGDVMLVTAYDYLNKIDTTFLHRIISLFNKTAKQVCEGQQLDMDYEKNPGIQFNDYLHMIELKTSVLLSASLQMGAIIGGAGKGNQEYLYEFGKNLGIAFQIQDDYLDAFGDPNKFGKEKGGDIKSNKKTFLLVRALEESSEKEKKKLTVLLQSDDENKVEKVLSFFKDHKINEWAKEMKQQYMDKAIECLEAVNVVSIRKESLKQLSLFLLRREH